MRVVLSAGMGVDSSAIKARWLLEPESRIINGQRFDLKDLICITAMTGDEFPDTKRLYEEHMLPLMREHGVRYVQVARSGRKTPNKDSGYTVLSDSDDTKELFVEGDFKLSNELEIAATLPTRDPTKGRLCTLKFKGEVLDAWMEKEFGKEEFIHVIGFSNDPHEKKRKERDKTYTPAGVGGGKLNRVPAYPLIDEWQWDRAKCIEYLEAWCGETWRKSCCVYCPFAGGGRERLDLFRRWREMPEAGAFAAQLETQSLALNPRMNLFGGKKSVLDIMQQQGCGDALEMFQEEREESTDWAVYRVRRVCVATKGTWTNKAGEVRHRKQWSRQVKRVCDGSFGKMCEKLEEFANSMGCQIEDTHGSLRFFSINREEDVLPTREEMFVVARGTAIEKEGPPFKKRWKEAS